MTDSVVNWILIDMHKLLCIMPFILGDFVWPPPLQECLMTFMSRSMGITKQDIRVYD
jgi:hypothetical protein